MSDSKAAEAAATWQSRRLALHSFVHMVSCSRGLLYETSCSLDDLLLYTGYQGRPRP